MGATSGNTIPSTEVARPTPTEPRPTSSVALLAGTPWPIDRPMLGRIAVKSAEGGRGEPWIAAAGLIAAVSVVLAALPTWVRVEGAIVAAIALAIAVSGQAPVPVREAARLEGVVA